MSARTMAPTGIAGPADLLRDLDRWMDAAHYAVDHPWRQSIAATLAAAASSATASPAPAVGHDGCYPVDILELTGRMWDVHGLVLAIGAVASQLEEELPDGDLTEPIRRLCRVTGDMLEQLATQVGDTPSTLARAAQQRAAQGGASTVTPCGAA